jgi:type IV pilus assembly protein PilE
MSLHNSNSSRRRIAGFTLLEVTIATAVSGVLASIAYPSVSGVLLKARRSEALVAMMQMQQAEERWRSGSRRYGSLAEIGFAATAPGGHYSLAVTDPAANGYVVLAQAIGSQAGDRPCRYMKLVVDGAFLTTSSGDTEATANTAAANRQCWNL